MILISRRNFITLASAATVPPSIAQADPVSATEVTLAELPLHDGSILRYSLAEVVAASGIPAISFATISRYDIASAKCYGLTAVVETAKVTVRRLMSHPAGLSAHGFPGYAFKASDRAAESRRSRRPPVRHRRWPRPADRAGPIPSASRTAPAWALRHEK